jgi:tetratricopeptide (TPR) repeat protein
MIRALLFALAAACAALVLVPRDADLWRAFERSAPLGVAEPYFASHVARDDDKARALGQIVRIRRQAGDLDGELRAREQLAQCAPEDLDNQEERVALLAGAGRTTEACAAAEELALQAPGRASVRRRLVELYEWIRRPAEAHVHASWLLEHGERGDRLARVFLAARDVERLAAVVASPGERGRLLLAMGAEKEAIEAFREHLRDRPGDTPARRQLARLLLWNHRALEAVQELETCLALDPDEALREEFLSLCRALNRIDLMLAYLPDGVERADALLALGRVDEAREAYERLQQFEKLLELSLGSATEDDEILIRERMPQTTENRLRLAALYVWRKEFRRAVKIYEDLGEERVIDLYVMLGDRDAALEAARRLDLPARLGELYLWRGDLVAAIREFERAGGFEKELPRLYIAVGRSADAVRLLDGLDLDPYVKAELYIYAGRGDLAVALVEAMPPGTVDTALLERLARASDGTTAERLYLVLLRECPGTPAYQLALADIYERTGRLREAEALLRELLRRDPDRAELLARLGLLVDDPALLERALALGIREPELLRRLGERAYRDGRRARAVELFRPYLEAVPGDYATRFLLAEMTGSEEEYERTWRSLPDGERRIRIRILLWRRDLEAAMRLIREVDEPDVREALVDLLIDAGREAEARDLGLTPRQEAVLAIRHGRYAQAAALLERLDLADPAIRAALAECYLALGRLEEAERLIPGIAVRHRLAAALKAGRLEEALKILDGMDLKDPELRHARGRVLYDLGRWQEARPWADDALADEIQGRYGPEASAVGFMRDAADERQVGAAARYRMYASERVWFRVEGSVLSAEGDVPALGDHREAELERVRVGLYGRLGPGLEGGFFGGAWNADQGEAFGGGELRWMSTSAYGHLEGEINDRWMDSIEALTLGESRHRLALTGGVQPWPWMVVSAGAEGLAYEGAELLEGERATETRLHVRTEFRPWSARGGDSGRFYDGTLRDPFGGGSYAGIMVQADLSEVAADDAFLAATRMVPRSRALVAGPVAAWSDETWGVMGSVWAGLDTARDFDPGELRGALGEIFVTVQGRWKLYSRIDYVSEQAEEEGGAGWTLTLGLNWNL